MGGVGKISHFLALTDNISKTVGDTSKVTLVTNRKSRRNDSDNNRDFLAEECLAISK